MTVLWGLEACGRSLMPAHFGRPTGIPTVVLRPFNAYGPRCHHEGDSGEVIPEVYVALPGR